MKIQPRARNPSLPGISRANPCLVENDQNSPFPVFLRPGPALDEPNPQPRSKSYRRGWPGPGQDLHTFPSLAGLAGVILHSKSGQFRPPETPTNPIFRRPRFARPPASVKPYVSLNPTVFVIFPMLARAVACPVVYFCVGTFVVRFVHLCAGSYIHVHGC